MMRMKYRCKESFMITVCDGDGFMTEEEMQIDAGSLWNDEGDEYRLCGGEYRLENEDGNYSWIEIDREYLEKYFEAAEEKKCIYCGTEKGYKFVGNSDGNAVYACVECMDRELRKACKEVK